jgi:hypothetical protein
MKTVKHISIVALTLLCQATTTLQAQQRDSLVNRNVTVEREYSPAIKPAGKINVVPGEVEPTIHKVVPTYITQMNAPMKVERGMNILSPAEPDTEQQSTPPGYLRLGIGNPINTLVEAGYPVVKREDLLFDISLRHLGTFNWQAHSKTTLKTAFDKAFKPFNLYASLGAGHDYFRYYGNHFDANATVIDDLDAVGNTYQDTPYEEILSAPVVTRAPYVETLSNVILNRLPAANSFFRLDLRAGIYTPDPLSNVGYNAALNYQLFSPRYGIVEHALHTQGGFNIRRPNGNRVGADLQLDNVFYNPSGEPMTFWQAYSVLTVNPHYTLEGDNWSIRLGLKSSFSFIHGKPVNPSLDLHGEWHIAPETFSLYGGITGDYVINTMNAMFEQNRFLYGDLRIKDTYIPFDAYLGAKVKPARDLLVDAYINFKAIDDQYFFVGKGFETSDNGVDDRYRSIYVNRFDATYSNASLLKAGGRVGYNYQNKIDLQLKAACHLWNVEEQQYAWLKPAWEINLAGQYKATEDLVFSLNTFFEGKRYARLGAGIVELKPVADINLGVGYSYFDSITFFAKVNNLLNSNYQIFNGYPQQGLNILIGASFTF